MTNRLLLFVLLCGCGVAVQAQTAPATLAAGIIQKLLPASSAIAWHFTAAPDSAALLPDSLFAQPAVCRFTAIAASDSAMQTDTAWMYFFPKKLTEKIVLGLLNREDEFSATILTTHYCFSFYTKDCMGFIVAADSMQAAAIFKQTAKPLTAETTQFEIKLAVVNHDELLFEPPAEQPVFKGKRKKRKQ
jgi:hypothetical protein